MNELLLMLAHFTGVLIGASAGGLVAHFLNYTAAPDKGTEQGILVTYVIILSAGIAISNGRPIVTTLAVIIGIYIIGKRLFKLIEPRIPNPAPANQDINS